MIHVHKRILLVDDESRIRALLKKYLEKENFIVEEADSGGEAIRNCYINGGNYNLMVLDWLLPDMSGIEICEYIKYYHQGLPIVMLSGRSEERDRLEGFRAGADDYVVKPFSPREVVLRIQSILARMEGTSFFEFNNPSDSEILISDLIIQPSARRVLVHKSEVHLTPKEYDLLYFLVTHQETAFSREELLKEVWTSSHQKIYDQRTVDTHIKQLREKLFFHSPKGDEFIRTVWGYGYMVCSTDKT
ncbi:MULTISPECIES: response regulator transcription factor [Paenibacillus]|uniref:Response regulator transcription factor n=2 Tax=Paenibacillus TaxID=44249 RepID=A0A7Y6EVF9_9BACL|nr:MULTISPECIES: response regulator transcription factor [Paenibacillus]KGP77352.1 hypothetical protein P364_0133390 [Paenibacillus sp. MAEPY2]KGP82196.1 hypothetical protein P363_0126980 [Paenibacillus sp. MAEPY1]MDN4603811.1 response regulator transcription factor [Paenibacillus vandeheii]NUU75684.1 response regulator transcription factor [Paenibacillus xylanilyticus]